MNFLVSLFKVFLIFSLQKTTQFLFKLNIFFSKDSKEKTNITSQNFVKKGLLSETKISK